MLISICYAPADVCLLLSYCRACRYAFLLVSRFAVYGYVCRCHADIYAYAMLMRAAAAARAAYAARKIGTQARSAARKFKITAKRVRDVMSRAARRKPRARVRKHDAR